MPQSRPKRSRTGLGLLVLSVLTGAMILTHFATLRWSAPELVAARDRLALLESEIETLSQRLDSTRTRLAKAEEESRVTRQANRLLREEESARQAELQRLQGELDFFRRLAGTSGTQTGLAVYQLELTPSASPRVYRFVLTLTQNLRRSAITTGTVEITLEGTLDDRPVTLPWNRIAGDEMPTPTFRFKYFEQLDGFLTLPEGFTPMRLTVSLQAKGQKKPVTRGFDWARLTESGPPDPVADTPAWSGGRH
ncbi:DUF6776 family protein [Wenzhouxiangellaceae bacterium CH-27]|uniref:DUF6776 family protein n=2 Tax=Elongatibacter sediminis TaxID=3119006 RepID=A0AAW9RAW1_9GAMM